MKLSSSQNTLDTSITTAADFGIEESDLSHIMGILRSQIYSDKLLAVIREYSTNARDANIEAGNSHRPIHVNVPTQTKPTLSFRDYGNGLTDEQVTSLYVKYGASTKRSSNDYTGCLGIGCKAAFAYGDSFTIKSYTLDTITTWLARIDESKRGTISLINSETNHTEPTGVEVSVTIRTSDYEECKSKIKKFFKFWKSDITSNLEESLTELDVLHSTDDWAIANLQVERNYGYRGQRNSATVVMGNIAYPVPENDFKDNGIHGLSLIHHENVIFYAPLGSLDIAANREALEITDRTRTGIISLANNMMLDLTKMLADEVQAQPTRILASIKATLFENSLGTTLNRTIASNCTWKGQKLIRTISLNNNSKTVIHKRERSWRNAGADDRNVRVTDVTMITLDEHLTLCTTDSTISEANSTRRVRTLQDKDGYQRVKRYAVIHADDLKNCEPKLEPADVTDLTTIEPLKPNRTIIKKAVGDTTKNVRINVCVLKHNELKSARLSKECEPTSMSDGRFVYVPLDRFDWDGYPDRLSNLRWIIDSLTHMTNDEEIEPITIHGVKKHHVSKLDDKWITLDMFYKEQLRSYKYRNIPRFKQIADQHACATGNTRSLYADLTLMSEVANTTIKYQAQQISNAGTVGESGILAVGTFLNVYTCKSNIIKEIKATLDKYPLLEIMQTGYYTARDRSEIVKEINKYIKSK